MAQHQEVTVSVTLTTNTETPVVEFQLGPQIPVSPVPPGNFVAPTMISGVISISNAGTGTTSLAVRVRQGIGTSGAQVGNTDTVSVSASSATNIPFRKLDPVGASSYTVTVQQNSATGSGLAYGSFDCDQNLVGIA
jgi:hypothetical protein